MHVRTYVPTSDPDKTKTYPLLYWVHCGVRLFFHSFERRETDLIGLAGLGYWRLQNGRLRPKDYL